MAKNDFLEILNLALESSVDSWSVVKHFDFKYLSERHQFSSLLDDLQLLIYRLTDLRSAFTESHLLYDEQSFRLLGLSKQVDQFKKAISKILVGEVSRLEPDDFVELHYLVTDLTKELNLASVLTEPKPGRSDDNPTLDITIDGDAFAVGGGSSGESTGTGLPDKLDPTEGTNPKQFYFELKGSYTNGRQIQCGSDVEIHFKYDVLSANALAKLKADKLEQLRNAAGSVDLTIIPKGLSLAGTEKPSKTANFASGGLVEPVVFALRAANNLETDAGILVIFRTKGSLIYECFLEIELALIVEKDARAATKIDVETLDLDDLVQAQNAETFRDYEVIIDAADSTFSLTIHKDGVFQQRLKSQYSPSDLADQLLSIGSEVEGVAGDELFATSAVFGAQGVNTAVDTDLQKSIDKIATAGWNLQSFLSKDTAFAQILKEIQALPPNKKITIHTDRCFVPWKILYPEEFHWKWVEFGTRASAKSHLFWGYRQLIEIRLLQLLTESGSKSKNYRRAKAPRKFVSLNVAPALEEKLSQIAGTEKYTHSSFFESTITEERGEFNDVPNRIKALLIGKESEASLIYFYCHGRSEHPFQSGQSESLELAPGDIIAQSFIPDTPSFSTEPVVFLNSCSSGAFSLLSFTNFHRKFKAVGVRGMIVTDFAVPILVGAVVGQKLVKSFLEGIPVGRALLDLTRTLLDKNNPVGLFYSLQCPADYSAAEGRKAA